MQGSWARNSPGAYSQVAILVVSFLVGASAPARAVGIEPSASGATVYVANVTKTLGGPSGWTTPVAIQNVGTSATTAAISVYRFSDGTLVTVIQTPSLQPRASWLFDPLMQPLLPHDSQFALVVRASSGAITAVVLEGAGTTWMSYGGTAEVRGSFVFLPNITRRLGGPSGWDTPFIVQNVGTSAVSATIKFYRFADGAHVLTLTARIEAGRSHSVSPWVIDGLADDTQYSVTIVSDGELDRLTAVVNQHQASQAMSYEGIGSPANELWLPNVLKYVGGPDGWSSPFVVQNIGFATSFDAEFYGTGTGVLAAAMRSVPLAENQGYPVDVRFAPAGLPPGQYSVVIRGAPGAALGAVVNQMDLGRSRSMSYTAISSPSRTAYAATVQKNSGAVRWSSTIIAQNAGSRSGDITVTLVNASGAVASRRTFTGVQAGRSVVYDAAADAVLGDGDYAATIEATERVSVIVNSVANATGDFALSYTAAAEPCDAANADPALTGVKGSVTYGGRPVAGHRVQGVKFELFIQTVYSETTTDASGRYTTAGMPVGQEVGVQLPAQNGYARGAFGSLRACANRLLYLGDAFLMRQ